ncbi:putative longevity assurance factor [Parathielavia appendiculata]|uniref:Longevity assurance factor n=1 Tax=Parathielavia appendiculata TaxID=2587402 RepID=A0AAN6Z014_9PEZI|nr:putative longevity assurance factor [Parathielavia appendiculata]
MSADPLQATAENGGSRHRRAKLRAQESPRLSSSSLKPASTRRRKITRGFPVWLFWRTWALPLVLMLAFVSAYAFNPTESNLAYHFLFLSYRLESGQYGKGRWDLAFVCFYTIFLSFSREFLVREVLQPLARLGGIRSHAKQARFTEQMYQASYIAFVGPLGVYAMKQTPGLWYFATRGMYESFPNRTHDAVFKFYYLFQTAFWIQQAIVMLLGQEKPRKDFKELIVHHIITIALISLSYRFHFTYIGLAVYITHDISDFFLAVSKSLNYLNHPSQAASFALCIAVWTYLRHYINLRILYSVATEFATVGPYELDWETQQYKCWISQIITFALLAALQALNLFWLYCLCRVAYRFVFLGIAKDDRSEAEESEAEAEGVERRKTLNLESSKAVEEKGEGEGTEAARSGRRTKLRG